MSTFPTSLVLVGAGKMGSAMLQGWLKLGMASSNITVLDPHVAPDVAAMCARAGVRLNPPLADQAAPDVLVLAIKPQMLDVAAPSLQAVAAPNTLVVSILAGKTLADIARNLPIATQRVRAMPNLPAAIGRGITGAYAGIGVSAAQRAMADALLNAVGQVEWLADEALMDAITAVSGSGPAYVFHLVECLAAAGEALGLESAMAMRLARATVEGAGQLMFVNPAVSAAELRVNVTSPGGTTAAALAVLMADDGLAPLMRRAVNAAKRRATALSG